MSDHEGDEEWVEVYSSTAADADKAPADEPAGKAAPATTTMQRAVRRELRGLKVDIRDAMPQLALYLARTIDATDGEETASNAARLAQELRVTLGQIREVARESGAADGSAGLSTPVWDGAQSGPSDAGPAGRGGSAPAR